MKLPTNQSARHLVVRLFYCHSLRLSLALAALAELSCQLILMHGLTCTQDRQEIARILAV